MTKTEKHEGVGGWDVPCAPIDYRKLEWAARQQCEIIRGRLNALKREKLRDGEKELLRRRTIRILTDMYYEQRSNIRLFQERAEKREKQGTAGKVESFPTIPAASA